MKDFSLSLILLVVMLCTITESGHAQTNRRRTTAPVNTAAPPQTLPVSAVLKDGQTLKGKFVGANSRKLSIMVGSSVQQIDMSEVASLIFSESGSSASNAESSIKAAAKEAVKAIRKLESATSVGVSFAEYGTRLIDAKADVDESLSRMSDGKLKTEIGLSMDEYSYASQVWQIVNREEFRDKYNTGYLYTSTELAESLMKKYKIEPHILPISKTSIIFRANILSAIWQAAKEHLDKAAQLANQ